MNSLYRGISLAAVFWTTVSMSAYTPHETGSRTTASGARAKEGYTCAANFVPMGSVIFYEGHKYVVQDRMNPKYNRHVDIFMESHKKALQFGRKEAKVQVITSDDRNVKLPKENKKTDKENRKTIKENKKTSKESKQNSQKEVKNVQPRQTEAGETKSKSNVKSPHSQSPAPATVLKPQARP